MDTLTINGLNIVLLNIFLKIYNIFILYEYNHEL